MRTRRIRNTRCVKHISGHLELKCAGVLCSVGSTTIDCLSRERYRASCRVLMPAAPPQRYGVPGNVIVRCSLLSTPHREASTRTPLAVSLQGIPTRGLPLLRSTWPRIHVSKQHASKLPSVVSIAMEQRPPMRAAAGCRFLSRRGAGTQATTCVSIIHRPEHLATSGITRWRHLRSEAIA